MKASDLIRQIERAGGQLRLGAAGQLQHRRVPLDLLRKLQAEKYCVTAILREHFATRAWEQSGHDPFWYLGRAGSLARQTFNHDYATAQPWAETRGALARWMPAHPNCEKGSPR